MTVPLAVAAAWAALRHVPETRDAQMTGRLDVVGGVLSIAALAGLTYAVIEVPNTGATSPAVVTALLGGLVASGAFVVAERRAAQPMLPFSIVSSRQFTWANVLCFTVYAALGGVAFLLVQQLIVVLGYSGTAAGLAFMPVSVVMLVLSQRSGAIAQQIGPRVPLTLGSATLAAAMVLMAFIDQGDSYHSTVLPAAVVFGLGLAAILAPVTATALAAADEQHAGIASGVNNAVSRVSQLLTVAALPGAAGLTSTAGDIPADVFATGFRHAMFITAALAALGAVIAWTTIRNDVLGGEEQEPAEAAAEGPAKQPGPPSQAGPAASSRRSTVGRPPNDGPPGWTVRYCIPTSRRRHDGVTVLRTCWPHHRPEPTAAISGGTPSPMVCPSEPLVSR